MMTRLIILDRDGVINYDSDQYIKSSTEFIPLPGSLQAIAQLCKTGFKVVVATNQSGIARQFFSLETLQSMHTKLQHLLKPLGGSIEHFYYCPHAPDDQCTCRKPKAGLFKQIAHDFNLSPQQLSSVTMVGDSLSDMKAGLTAGTQVALVRSGKGLLSLKKINQTALSTYLAIPVYDDLADFTRCYLQKL
jgi:D-glycero-D-manno-heptose 1,7-bisphosphate phosphatase